MSDNITYGVIVFSIMYIIDDVFRLGNSVGILTAGFVSIFPPLFSRSLDWKHKLLGALIFSSTIFVLSTIFFGGVNGANLGTIFGMFYVFILLMGSVLRGFVRPQRMMQNLEPED